MGDFGKFLVKAYLRKYLTILGTALLTHGVINDSEAGGFVDQYLEEVLGAVLLGGSHVWTFLYQRYVRRKVTTALGLPASATTETLKKAMQRRSAVASGTRN